MQIVKIKVQNENVKYKRITSKRKMTKAKENGEKLRKDE